MKRRSPLRRSTRPWGSTTKGRDPRRFGTSAQKKRILAAQAYVCFYCHETLSYEQAVLDHKVSWRDGGPTTDENLAAVHRAENRAKGNMDAEAFRLSLHQTHENH